ncbi:hypothetical protein LZK73_21910 [Neorhizobium galegae]|nr:hypothetical protein LZK73_21910 [Neorhizobium galegae]
MADERLLRDLYAGIEVLKSQQTEINRRLGLIEKKLEDDENAEDESRTSWKTWIFQTVGQVLLVSGVVAIGKIIGLELIW